MRRQLTLQIGNFLATLESVLCKYSLIVIINTHAGLEKSEIQLAL